MADNETPEKPLTTGEWFVTLLVLGLPLIGFIMTIVWALSGGNIGRRNFCRASLLFLVVALGLAMLVFGGILVFGGTMGALLGRGHH